MAVIDKPRVVSASLRPFERDGRCYLVATALVAFDLKDGDLQTEQTLWRAAVGHLPGGAVIDEGMFKPNAEVVVSTRGGAAGRILVQRDGETILDSRSDALGPIALGDARRRRHAGTHDERWLRTHFPGLPTDGSWKRFFVRTASTADRRVSPRRRARDGRSGRGIAGDEAPRDLGAHAAPPRRRG